MSKYDITVEFAATKPHGNIYGVLILVKKAMKKAGLATEYEALQADVYASKSYEAALARIREDITLIDTDGRF